MMSVARCVRVAPNDSNLLDPPCVDAKPISPASQVLLLVYKSSC